MTAKANPASGGTLGGAGDVHAGKRCDPRLNSQARQIDYFVDAGGFQHAYGDRPPGKGWWSPFDEGPYHHVRSARRRQVRR